MHEVQVEINKFGALEAEWGAPLHAAELYEKPCRVWEGCSIDELPYRSTDTAVLQLHLT